MLDTKLSRLPFYALAPVAAGVVGVLLESSGRSVGVTAGAVILAAVLVRILVCYYLIPNESDNGVHLRKGAATEAVSDGRHEREKASAG